jgi:hypothetical protein
MAASRSTRIARTLLAGLLVLTGFTSGCARPIHTEIHSPSEVTALDSHSRFLKAHMRDGSRYELTHWDVDLAHNRVSGDGRLVDEHSDLIHAGALSVPIDSVSVFETNSPGGMPPALMAFTVIVGSVVALGLAKVIFGSCPTFYLDDGKEPVLQAEGFSSSIAPPLEATDVDALYRAHPSSRQLEIVMKNEALETHVVRFVNVLAAPRPEGGRVLATTLGTFRQATSLAPPDRAEGPEGDCLAALRTFDGVERFSTADSTDLATHEWLELEFQHVPSGDLGLVVASRQTLMSTFLLYRSLANMGGSAGEFLAAYNRSAGKGRQSLNDHVSGFSRALGGVDVYLPDAHGRWNKVGRSKETGPLAADLRVVPLPRPGPGPLRVRLSMARGDWRLDYVALAALGRTVDPIRLAPVRVERAGVEDDSARTAMLDPARALVTGPGDEYRFVYELPEDFADRELFLESRGYYLEWIRDDWVRHADRSHAMSMLRNPRKALRQLAPEFKHQEASLEQEFWNSRYARPH